MSVSEKFLEAVADCLVKRIQNTPERLCVVLPNKRAGIFLRGYMRRRIDKPALMPRLMTIGAFSSQFNQDNVIEADAIEQLFIVYEAYKRVCAQRGIEPMPFDRFSFWGNMMVSDFDDIDANMADASKVYENLSDLNEINSYYLSEEQIEAVTELWGDRALYTFTPPDENTFWKHISHIEDDFKDTGESGDGTSVSKRFVKLWEIMGDIYVEFHKILEEKSMTTPGLSSRRFAQAVRDCDRGDLTFDRVAFVGFSRLSKSLVLVMKNLRKRGMADFFWDRLGAKLPALSGADYIDRYAKAFKMPADFNAPAESDPNVEIVAVPSNFMQTKIIGDRIGQWHKAGIIKERFADNTVIALPDTSLLASVIHALPNTVDPVNITMGLSFRTTPFATLLRSLTSMQMRSRIIHDEPAFFHEDVTQVISHPLVRGLAPAACTAIQEIIVRKNRYNIPAAEIRAVKGLGLLECIFVCEGREPWKPKDVLKYINDIADALVQTMEERREEGLNVNEKAHEMLVLNTYVAGAESVFEYIDEYGTGYVGRGTLFALFERIMSGQTLNVSGTPVKGLQIMGMLETRALDFDNVIIPSMNEHVYPRRSRMRTLIPQNLRRAYGLTVADDAEREYAYYFFRLLSRARNVTVTYSSASGGMGNGAPSRHLLQLMYLSRIGKLKRTRLNVPATPSTVYPIVIEKDADVMKRLAAFKDPNPATGRNLSATALKAYRSCPLKFYVHYVLGIGEDDEPTGYMDAATYGSVVHSVLEDLFNEQVPEGQSKALIDAKAIERMAGEGNKLLRRVVAKINDLYFHHPERGDDWFAMPGESKLLAEQMRDYIERILQKEKDTVTKGQPFWFIAAEESLASSGRHANCAQWRINDNLSVNFRLMIDRHDIMGDGTHRFIDYKTGADKPQTTGGIESLFSSDNDKARDAIFQLLVYCEAYTDITGRQMTIKPALYRLRDAFFKTAKPPFDDDAVYVEKNMAAIWTNVDGEPRAPWQPVFREKLEALIEEIFDPEVDFCQTPEKPKNCTYCPLTEICGVIVQEKD